MDALALDGGRDPIDVLGGDVEQARILSYAGVSRRAQQLGHSRGARERAHQRMLASTASHDQDLHITRRL